MARRARIVLLAADRWASRAIAREVGVMTGVVSVWRTRFATSGRQHIDALIDTCNENAEPFAWTKAQVHQRRVKGRRLSDL